MSSQQESQLTPQDLRLLLAQQQHRLAQQHTSEVSSIAMMNNSLYNNNAKDMSGAELVTLAQNLAWQNSELREANGLLQNLLTASVGREADLRRHLQTYQDYILRLEAALSMMQATTSTTTATHYQQMDAATLQLLIAAEQQKASLEKLPSGPPSSSSTRK